MEQMLQRSIYGTTASRTGAAAGCLARRQRGGGGGVGGTCVRSATRRSVAASEAANAISHTLSTPDQLQERGS